jgi:hypothetical protein
MSWVLAYNRASSRHLMLVHGLAPLQKELQSSIPCMPHTMFAHAHALAPPQGQVLVAKCAQITSVCTRVHPQYVTDLPAASLTWH